ncbi:MAG: PTS sugar transporter subunit IIA [Spirochaetes bacterium]|nr:PTS sugar transporter subunit IIA [Spirochaetota bacterium]
MKSLVEFTNEKYFKKIKAKNKIKAIEELALVFKDSHLCSDIGALISALKEREAIMSTGVGFGLAIPHAKIREVKDPAFAIGVSAKGIDFDSIDGNPVNIIILVAAGEKQHREYLHLLSSIMAIIKEKKVRDKIINSKSIKDTYKLFASQIFS